MKTIFKGNPFSIVWNIIDRSTNHPFEFTGMKVEVGIYSDSFNFPLQSYNVNNGTITAEIESNTLPAGVFNLMCRYSTEHEQSYCTYRNAFQISSRPCHASEIVEIESYASHIDPSSEDPDTPDYSKCQLIAEELFGVKMHLPELTAHRAIADEFGNRIIDTYVTRNGLTNHIKETYNQQFTENPPVIMEGYITPEMLSEETRQMLESTGREITNLPDGEDLTTIHGVLKLANKQHNPNTYSGLGRQYLRKNIVAGVNILTQSMMQWPNTIYIIQYDYDLQDAEITIPEGCVLDFQGGSFNNGIINLNDTLILNAYNSFKENSHINGSVINEEVNTVWWVLPKENSYSEFIDIVNISNNSNIPIKFKKGEYTFVYNGTDVIIKQSIDFNDSVINLNTNGYEEFNLLFSNSKIEDIEPSYFDELSAAINSANAKADIFKKFSNCLLCVTSNETELLRYGTPVPITKSEHLYIDINGYLTNEPFNDNINITSGYYIRCEGSLYVKNVIFNIVDNFSKEQSVTYRSIGVVFKNCSNITYKNVIINDPHIDNYRLALNGFTFCYNTNIENCNFTNTKDNTNAVGSEKSAYVFLMSRIINLRMKNVIVGGLVSNAWGATGTNYITNWYVENCQLNRIDTHHRLNNLYIYNSIIGNQGITYTGFGNIYIENCEFRRSSMLSPRGDYGAFFDGDIIIKNCRFSQTSYYTFLVIAEIYNFDFKCNSRHFKHVGAKNIFVDNVSFSDKQTTYDIYRTIYHDNSNEYLILREHPNLFISNIVKPIEVSFECFTDYAKVYTNKEVIIKYNNINFSQSSLTYVLGNSSYSDYIDTENVLPNINFYITNCKNVSCLSHNRKTKTHISQSEVAIIGNSFTINNIKYTQPNKILIFDSFIKPPLEVQSTLKAPDGELIYFYDCIFSAPNNVDYTIIKSHYNFAKFLGGYIYSDKTGNIHCYNCKFDYNVSEALGVSINVIPKTYSDIHNIENPYYFKSTNENNRLELSTLISQGITKFSLNVGDGPMIIVVPDTSKYNLTMLEFYIYSAFSGITFEFSKDGQTVRNIPSTIYSDFDGSILKCIMDTEGLRFFDNRSKSVIETYVDTYMKKYLVGSSIYNKTINKPLWWNGTNWVTSENNSYKAKNWGYSHIRPLGEEISNGFCYFDISLNKPIWWTGSKWVDATGAEV